MPFLQQKSAKKGPESCLIIGPDAILVILRCDDGRSPDHTNVCR